jgi:hypothetical protein
MNEPTSSPSSPLTVSAGSLPEPVVERPAGGSASSGDYREQLGSRRWDAAPLRNPEVAKTDPRIAVAAILVLAALTLLILVVGYASGFWALPTGGAVSGAVAALELLA